MLAARSRRLNRALASAKKAGHTYVVIDGTLIAIDRVAADRPFCPPCFTPGAPVPDGRTVCQAISPRQGPTASGPATPEIFIPITNPIESTFATVRHRTKVTKGPGSRAAGLAMAFKLIESAQDRWRAVNAPHFVALVRAGATFINGKLVERPGENTEPEAA